ncbi:MAG: cytochrome c oxidase assembly protein [Candidatus Hodgkinia cicadicola]
MFKSFKRSLTFPIPTVTFVTFVCLLIIQSYNQTCSTVLAEPNVSVTANEVGVMISFEAYLSSPQAASFEPITSKAILLPGEVIKADYILRNNSHSAITAEAVYNVTPSFALKHFVKLECFCFKRIVLNPGSEIVLPLVFFIDPRIKLEPSFVRSLTLTYIMNLIPSNFQFQPPSSEVLPSATTLSITAKSGNH